MLLPFVVSFDSLVNKEYSDATDTTSHNALFSLWRKYGVLVHGSNEIFLQVKKIRNQTLRKRWLEALTYFRTQCQDKIDDSILSKSIDELMLYKDIADTIIIDDTEAIRVFKFPHDKEHLQLGENGIELCRMKCINASNAFRKAEQDAYGLVKKNESIESLWKRRFELITKNSNIITVVDRYCLENHFKDGDQSALLNFMNYINKTTTLRVLNIYTGHKHRDNEKAILSDIHKLADSISKGSYVNVNEINLFVIKDADFRFRADCHARYLQFINHNAGIAKINTYLIDLGLAIFKGKKADSTSDIKYVDDCKHVNVAIEKLRVLAKEQQTAFTLIR
ncbi:hypothetical protein [Geobacter anodireducens]